MVVLPHALTIFNASVIIALAQRYRMPDVHALAEAAAVGGLVSYGLNWNDQFRRAAEYTGRILQGEKPANPAGPSVHDLTCIQTLEVASLLAPLAVGP